MKYVILKENAGDVVRMHHLIFPEHMTHVVVSTAIQHQHFKETQQVLEPVSGGFCELNVGYDWECERGSISMNILPDKEGSLSDSRILNMPEAMQGLII